MIGYCKFALGVNLYIASKPPMKWTTINIKFTCSHSRPTESQPEWPWRPSMPIRARIWCVRLPAFERRGLHSRTLLWWPPCSKLPWLPDLAPTDTPWLLPPPGTHPPTMSPSVTATDHRRVRPSLQELDWSPSIEWSSASVHPSHPPTRGQRKSKERGTRLEELRAIGWHYSMNVSHSYTCFC